MARILLVIDDDFRFGEPAETADFTFTTLVGALTAGGHQVTKANRSADATADLSPFNFVTSVNLLEFDVLWMIGHAGRNSPTSSGTSGAGIDPTEIAAIARFMEAGGGVFATGDHDSIGSEMCGRIPMVRAMRCWFGVDDSATPMPSSFPINFPVETTGRADTLRKNPLGHYDVTGDGVDDDVVWFENQSDSVPQTLTPTTAPAHPILRRGSGTITVYPDHMHEGNTLGVVQSYVYGQTLAFGAESFIEFKGSERPEVIATGDALSHETRYAADDSTMLDGTLSDAKTVNTLSVYEGRNVGVGRIVTGSTFHHYIDINLTGDSTIDTAGEKARTGPDAAKGHGFNDAPSTLSDIETVYVNIANWLARPGAALTLVLERSTFSQDEATAAPDFDGAFSVVVDGLKPNQFPGGAPTVANAPLPTLSDDTGIQIACTAVDSDDPGMPDRLQRITFTYRVHFVGTAAFTAFTTATRVLTLTASLASSALAQPLTDTAFVQLVKSANPFLLDLDGGNTTTWLSSDIRVFPVVAGGAPVLGHSLAAGANRTQALAFLQTVLSGLTTSQFQGLQSTEDGSALSPLPTTTATGQNVYNFAIARVRLNHAAAMASAVRVFFRIFTSQTTAALTYTESPPGVPIEGYAKTAGADPIALPGTTSGGTEWLSFPFFATGRMSPPDTQTDGNNVKNLSATTTGTSTFYGALVDNNLSGAYLGPTPLGGAPVDLPTLLMGEHQCIVAQIEYAGAPIPSGAGPATSDKLAQRNLAFSTIANPGLDLSRTALHTFEIEATPQPIADGLPPDELVLTWTGPVPEGTRVRLVIPSWSARDVVALADRFYARHELRALDADTVEIPGGGTRYVPIPRSLKRQTGVLLADFPLGIRKGQRFDVSVRQITNRSRIRTVNPKNRVLTRQEAEALLKERGGDAVAKKSRGGGVYDLGQRRTLITDLSVLDATGDHAVLIERPDPSAVAAAARESATWRQSIGAFQLAIPVSVESEMLPYHLRILSVLRWRAEHLRPTQRWYATFLRYLAFYTEKVRALGGDPYKVPPTPDGVFPGAIGQPGEPGGGTPGAAGGAQTCTGKVSGLLFDHFGDFEGFTLETYDGGEHRFYSREEPMLALVRTAWVDRCAVTVITVSGASRQVRRILLRGPPR